MIEPPPPPPPTSVESELLAAQGDSPLPRRSTDVITPVAQRNRSLTPFFPDFSFLDRMKSL